MIVKASNHHKNEEFFQRNPNAPSWVRIAYVQIQSFILSLGNDVSVRKHNTHVAFYRKGRFLTIVENEDAIECGLIIPSLIFTPRFVSQKSLCDQKITHYTSIRDPSDLNQELLNWIAGAYELNRPPSDL